MPCVNTQYIKNAGKIWSWFSHQTQKALLPDCFSERNAFIYRFIQPPLTNQVCGSAAFDESSLRFSRVQKSSANESGCAAIERVLPSDVIFIHDSS